MAGVELKNVAKRFGDTVVIDDVSLSIRPNEFVVFLGPSGCGKTTLLRMIAGLETADEGEIWIGDDRVDQLAPGARGVAMVFQHYALYPHMTIRENMGFGLANIGVPKAEIASRVDEAAAMLEIGHLLDRKPTQLSGGQKQRVAIGRAIVKKPKLFLFDEPLSNLDAALRSRTRVELAQLHRRMQSTMIFVTHDQVEAMTLADRIVLLNDRRIEQIGTPMEIYTRPATEFVASFVGSPKINLIPATVEAGQDGFVSARLGDGTVVNTRIASGTLPSGKIRLGVRPESIGVGAAASAGAVGKAEVVERLGDRTLIHARLGDGSLVVAEDEGFSRVQVGDGVALTFDQANVHIFDEAGVGHHPEAAPDDRG